MQVEKIADYARAKSTAAAAAAVAAVAAAAAAACALCSTAVMRRLSIDAMCMGRAVRCACGAVTRPTAQSTITLLLTARVCSKNKTALGAPAWTCYSS